MKRFVCFTIICMICVVSLFGSRFTYIKMTYPRVLKQIEFRRTEFYTSYRHVESKKERELIIAQARDYLNNVIPRRVLPAWYGTPWAFSGDTQQPLSGTIACGSFVENVLRNTGFVIDHRMSMLPSELIIKNMCQAKDIMRFSNARIDAFNDDVQNMGDGVYIVGLDRHVGFLYILNGKYRFVHAHGYLFVLSEKPSFSSTLSDSKYRVVGRLFSNRMVEKWLNGSKLAFKYHS